MSADTIAALRALYDKWVEPPKETVGKLPKAGVKLDYVGHANVTRALLECDPAWTWEPLAVNEDGLPAYDKAGGLWIRLTVCGVSRLGYGDGPDPKQRVSDAIRNAAMRFGVALSLWSKEEWTEPEAHEPKREDVATERAVPVKRGKTVPPEPLKPTADVPLPGDPPNVQAELKAAVADMKRRGKDGVLDAFRRWLLDQEWPPFASAMSDDQARQSLAYLIAAAA